jgi:hypothetical protein
MHTIHAHNGCRAMTLDELFRKYEPFDVLAEFKEGFEAYGKGKHSNPYCGTETVQSIKAEAWDRGREAALRWKLERIKGGASAVILNFPFGGRRKR